MFFAKTAMAASLLGGSLGLALGQQTDKYQSALQGPGSGFNTASHITQFYTGSANDWRNQGVQVQNARTGKIYPKSDRQYRRLRIGDIVIIDKSLVSTRDFRTFGYSPAALCENSSVRWCAERLSAYNDTAGINAALPDTAKVPVWLELRAPNPPPAVPQADTRPPAQPPAAVGREPGLPALRSFLRHYWPWILLLLLLAAAILALLYWPPLRRKVPWVALWLDNLRGSRRPRSNRIFWKFPAYYRLRDLLSASGANYSLRRSAYGLLVKYDPQDRPAVRAALDRIAADYPDVPLAITERTLEEAEISESRSSGPVPP